MNLGSESRELELTQKFSSLGKRLMHKEEQRNGLPEVVHNSRPWRILNALAPESCANACADTSNIYYRHLRGGEREPGCGCRGVVRMYPNTFSLENEDLYAERQKSALSL